MAVQGRIVKVAGPLVVAEGMQDAKMFDVVEVSEKRLIGEIIEMRDDNASIQVYEETGGLGYGDPVISTGKPLSVMLGPGMIEGIYDGIQRPLDKIMDKAGALITRGIHVDALDRTKKWEFNAVKKAGDTVIGGDIVGTVQETTLVECRIMVPPNVSGTLTEINSGTFTIDDTIGTVTTKTGVVELKLVQLWPVRQPRPYKEKLSPSIPLITGQRVIDAFFPIAKGGAGCVPGPFGSGKTVIQHQLAKWADAEIIVYIGCGERGNEMTDVLKEFPELQDPRSGEPLMRRTVLIANTSNMPVAAREASVYTGVAIAEFYRDMGYSVAIMADSTSRWAEAMREMSGRLEEMPGDEGYPAYLGGRIASFYERAGRVKALGTDDREGALSIIGAVSPPGGDLSDPVVQSTLRVVKVFWSLKAELAYQRHFPAIDWLTSYTLYKDNFNDYFVETIGEDWKGMIGEAMRLLQEEADLQEIVRLVGIDALSDENRLIMEVARSIREDFLHQNAFHDVDTFTSFKKQYKMLNGILKFYTLGRAALGNNVPAVAIAAMPIREDIARLKYISENELDKMDELERKLKSEFEKLESEAAAAV